MRTRKRLMFSAEEEWGHSGMGGLQGAWETVTNLPRVVLSEGGGSENVLGEINLE